MNFRFEFQQILFYFSLNRFFHSNLFSIYFFFFYSEIDRFKLWKDWNEFNVKLKINANLQFWIFSIFFVAISVLSHLLSMSSMPMLMMDLCRYWWRSKSKLEKKTKSKQFQPNKQNETKIFQFGFPLECVRSMILFNYKKEKKNFSDSILSKQKKKKKEKKIEQRKKKFEFKFNSNQNLIANRNA